jgi:hypothetical protein
MAAPLAKGLSAQNLAVRVDGDYVHIAAPQLQFLSGRILDRLHDGATVGFLGQISLSLDSNATVYSRSVARFAVSFAIWEESNQFQVTFIQQTRRVMSHLSLDAAQNNILDNLTLAISALPVDRPFWLRLDLRVEEPRDASEIISGSGINLTRLVEIFGRMPGAAQPHWTVDAGPLRIADVRTRAPKA